MPSMRRIVFFLLALSSVSVTSALQIVANAPVSNSTLNGHYAFSFNGFNNGTPFIMAGAFVADGAGNITSGKIDLNNGSGEYNDPSQCRGNLNCPIPEVIQSSGSVYDLSAGNGLGTMAIVAVDHLGNPTTFRFSIAIPSASGCVPSTSYSTCGRLIQRDPSSPQIYGSGLLKAQDSTYFQVNTFFPGNFAVLVNGIDPSGHRYAGAGAFGTNPSTLIDIDCGANGWGLNHCPLDIDDNGQAAANPFQGSFSADLDPNTGRGSFVNMVFPADPHGYCAFSAPCGYAFYVVNKQEMILISSNPLSKPANLTLWSVVRQSQSGGWNLGSLKGMEVMELNGVDPNGSRADITAGVLSAHGNGSATFNWEENDGGTFTRQFSQVTYSIDGSGQKSGRIVLGASIGPFSPHRVLYLFAANTAFAVGMDAKVTSGTLQPQSGAPFSNASISGLYAGGSSLPVLSTVTNSVTSLIADGRGHIMATQYTSGPDGPGGPNSLTLTYQVDPSGRAVVQTQSGQEYGVLYVVGPNKFVLVPSGNAPAVNDFASGS